MWMKWIFTLCQHLSHHVGWSPSQILWNKYLIIVSCAVWWQAFSEFYIFFGCCYCVNIFVTVILYHRRYWSPPPFIIFFPQTLTGRILSSAWRHRRTPSVWEGSLCEFFSWQQPAQQNYQVWLSSFTQSQCFSLFFCTRIKKFSEV